MTRSTIKTDATTASDSHDISKDPRWEKVLKRDQSALDFVFAVKSTGIYCLARCPARRPNPENITFYSTPTEAQDAGYRACKRCKPDQAEADHHLRFLIENACRKIEQSDEPLSLTQLAQSAGLSPSYFQRQFKAITGMTPKLYTQGCLANRVRGALLKPENNVTQSIYDAGYQSASRFYHNAESILGMTATEYQKGGLNMEIRFAIAECSLGSVLIASTTQGICAVTLGDDPELLAQNLQDMFPKANIKASNTEFENHIAAVIAHIENPSSEFDLPLDIQGTLFQQKVWQTLRTIPNGQTLSYSELAERIGQPTANRAVASACGANKIAVIIPCHRIVRQNGDLSGYRWGVERKRALLLKEKQIKEA